MWRNVAAAAMALIIFTNIYFANSFYLRSQLQYENRKAFYTTMLTRVMQTEGFSAGSKLAIIGNVSLLSTITTELRFFELSAARQQQHESHPR